MSSKRETFQQAGSTRRLTAVRDPHSILPRKRGCMDMKVVAITGKRKCETVERPDPPIKGDSVKVAICAAPMCAEVMSEKVMYIGESIVPKYLTVAEVIRRVEDTWRWYGEGTVVMPPKVTLDMSALGVKGWVNSMPSYVQATDCAGIKWVGGYEDNPKHGRPYIRAKIFLADPRTGDLRAVVAGDWISDMRTGAQPAIACKYLAASTEIVTIIGTGRQAYASLLCMSKGLAIREVRLCDLLPAARRRFISLFPNAPFKLVEFDRNEEACRGSDVIITVTNADTELVQEPWVKEGALVLTMGSFTETADDVVLKADKIITDHIGQTLHRGNIASMAHRGLVNEASFAAELPDIVAGKQVGRENSHERITCQLVGMGAPDAAIAALLIENMQRAGVAIPTFDLI